MTRQLCTSSLLGTDPARRHKPQAGAVPWTTVATASRQQPIWRFGAKSGTRLLYEPDLSGQCGLLQDCLDGSVVGTGFHSFTDCGERYLPRSQSALIEIGTQSFGEGPKQGSSQRVIVLRAHSVSRVLEAKFLQFRRDALKIVEALDDWKEYREVIEKMVARDGVEPPTPAFSEPWS